MRKAAERLNLKPSTVSHQLKTLEEQIGVTLFHRTTRTVTLTEAGQLLFRGSSPAFSELEAAVQSARDAGRSHRGSLRVTMPGFVYDLVVANQIKSFRDAHPDIELEISVNETFVDLFESEFHAGIRLGDRVDPDMIAVRLSPPMRMAVLASEEYLKERGVPETPEKLVEHECIRYRFATTGQFAPWEFADGDGSPYSVTVGGNLIVNTLPSLYAAVAQGLGLGYSFSEYRPNGVRVVSILEEHINPLSGMYFYYPREYRTRHLIRLFVDHLRTTTITQ